MERDKHFENNFPVSDVRLNDLMPDMYNRMNTFVTHLLFRLNQTIKNHGVVAEPLAQNMIHFASICMNIFNISMDFYDKEEESSQEEKNMHGRPKLKKKWDKEIKRQTTTQVINTIQRIIVLAEKHQGGEKSPLKGELPAKIGRPRAIKGGSRKLSKKRSVTYRRRSRRRNTNKIS
jgi:hypothetical protein